MTNLDDALSRIDELSDDELVDVLGTPDASALDRKINEQFPGVVVRKDLVKAVRGNAVVPSYVLEYLLGQYAASDDEQTIQEGIESVRSILAEHYVHRAEAGLIRSTIRDRGRHRIIDKVSVALNDKNDVHEAEFSNLQIKGVKVDDATVKAHPKLLVGGVWCICDVEYEHSDDPRSTPWVLGSLKPIQLSKFDFPGYLGARAAFTTDEWIDTLVQSIGFDPSQFSRRSKLLQLIRLVPFVERNYNLVELGPKGTGKSHIFSEFSPHGMLISGGEVTVPKLFVNNANGRLGLVGYWDVVAFDEFAGANKRVDRALVDIMKNYLANRTFSRGVETLSAEASMVFIGNTSHTVAYMLKHSDLFDELPAAYHDSAYLDRLHHYIPGWEVDPIRSEMFSSGYGFVVDYIAEVLKSMRSLDFSDRYQQHFTLGSDISTRDRDGIHKTFSGLMKLLFPHEQATEAEIEELLRLSIEGRKRVKDQILRIDATMRDSRVEFGYRTLTGEWRAVTTVEEDNHPLHYNRGLDATEPSAPDAVSDAAARPRPTSHRDPISVARPLPIVPSDAASPVMPVASAPLFTGHRQFQAGQSGVSYENLLLPYLVGATKITVVDPYIRMPHQGRNLADLLSLLAVAKDDAEEIDVELVTTENPDAEFKQRHLLMLKAIKDASDAAGVRLAVALRDDIHDRSITTDHGWRINLGKGLDIWERPTDNPYDFAKGRQEFRVIKQQFGVTYLRDEAIAN